MTDRRSTRGALPKVTSGRLVGRERDLDAVVAAVAEPPGAVLIEGEAGIGKTRLVHELLRQPVARTRRHLIGHCHPAREPFPLGAIVDALRTLGRALEGVPLDPVVGAIRPLLPELQEHLPAPLDALDDRLAERHRVYRGVLELVRALGPTIIVLEDLHWADDATIDLVRFLVDHLPDRASLLLTYRPEELPAASPLWQLSTTRRVSSVVLAPLEPTEVHDLMTDLLGGTAPAEGVADYVHHQTSGLPFAVEEVVGLLREQHDEIARDASPAAQAGGTPATPGLTQLRVPKGVRDSVLQHRARLPVEAQSLVDVAAVLGVPADEPLLRAVSRLSDAGCVDALSHALAAGMLTETADGLYALRHGLARDAVYGALPSPRRRALHGAAADALAAERGPRAAERLAYHSLQAGRMADWCRYATRAADLAIAHGNDEAAIDLLLELAARDGLPPNERAEVVAKLAEAALRALRHPRVIPTVRRVLEDGGVPPEARGELRFLLGRLLLQAGELAAGREAFLRALPDLEDRPAVAARAMASIAWAAHLGARPLADLEWLERADALSDRHDDALVKLIVLVDRIAILLRLGNPVGWELARSLPTTAPTGAERFQLVRGHANVAAMASSVGHYERAHRHLAIAQQLSWGQHAGGGSDFMEHTAILLDWQTGRWDSAEARMAAYLDAPRPRLDQLERAVHCLRSLLHVARGAVSFDELLGAYTHACAAHDHESVAMTGSMLIRVRLSAMAVDDALATARQALDIVLEDQTWTSAIELLPAAVAALVSGGLLDEAERLVALIATATSERDMPASAPVVAVARARLEDARGALDAAADLLEGAVAAWSQMPFPYAAAQATELLGDLVVRRDDTGAAEVLVRALESYEELGALWDSARVRRTLRWHGITHGARRGRRSYGSQLSPREREIVQLAASGLTDRQIAEQLFLSARTVEGHISRALAKLQLESRRELADVPATVYQPEPELGG